MNVGAASAATYCVDLAGGECDFTYTGSAGLGTALANAGMTQANDVIRIAAGTYAGPFTYTPSGNDGTLQIVGAGVAETVLTIPVPGASEDVLQLQRDAIGSRADVSGLSVVIPPLTSAVDVSGIESDGHVQDTTISAAGSATNLGRATGITLHGGGSGIERTTIEMNGVNQATAVDVLNGSTVTTDSAPAFIDASSALDGLVTVEAFAPLHVTRSRVSATGNTAIIARGTQVTVDDSLVLSSQASALRAESEFSGSSASLLARQDTIVAVGSAGSFAGLDCDASDPNATVSIDARHVIIRGFTDAVFQRAAMTSKATVSLAASDYQRGTDLAVGPGITTLTEPQPNIDTDPQFVDALAGDYHLADTSPAIDASYSPALAADEPLLDLDGQPRVQDGNGDGVPARDMGAFEHPAVPHRPAQTAPAPTSGGTPPPGAPHPLALSSLRITPASFTARQLHRAIFSFNLSGGAQVTFTLRRVLTGFARAHGCVAAEPNARRGRPCVRYRTVATFIARGAQGPNRIAFPAALPSRATRPGRYRALVTATAISTTTQPAVALYRIRRG
jgi:hypothetical protein